MSAAGVVPKAESASLSYEPFDLLDSQSLSDETRRFRFKNDEKFLGFLVIVNFLLSYSSGFDYRPAAVR